MANLAWWERFSKYSVPHLPHNFSDHSPLLISSKGRRNSRVPLEGHGFRFNVDCALKEGFEEQN